VKRIGLLGGGQLARMLALRGHSLGLDMHVLSESAFDPAAQVVKHHHVGDPNDEIQVRKFLESVDLATFESEFLDAETLRNGLLYN
jgi:5-(carboxyamino)imidazole ribonucleotide synthase